MKLGRKVLMAVAGAALATSVFAGSDMKPLCPSAAAIQTVGLSSTMEYFPGYFVGMEENDYHTDSHWLFAIGPVKAENESEALEAAHTLLADLNGPVDSAEEDDAVICFYDTAKPDAKGIAVSSDDLMSRQKVQRLLKKYQR
ncbi:MAG: DUF4949 domain-containing protein [Legionellaceae bacterium]|nr:DUF4949 domain-containing protein [Legionellaceae bacterium]